MRIADSIQRIVDPIELTLHWRAASWHAHLAFTNAFHSGFLAAAI